MIPDKYHIVTGLTRSGSSCMMGCLRECGIPIAGWKFPVDLQMPNSKGHIMGGTDVCIEDKHVKKNPMGFWEVPVVVRQGLREPIYDGALIKVPSESLLVSKAKLVDKAVFMVRHPDAQINSLYKDVNFVYTYDTEDLYYMMAYRHVASIKWLLEKEKEFIFVEFESLLARPVQVLSRITTFLGRGDVLHGSKYIKPSLKRSKSLPRLCDGRKVTMEVYNKILEEDLHYFQQLNIKELEQKNKEGTDKSIRRRRAAQSS